MMKTSLPYLLTCFACTAFLLTGCGGSNDDPTPAPEETFTLDVSETSFPGVDPNGGTVSFNVTSDTQWNVTSNSSWCKLNMASGTGNKTITATIAPNESEQARKATITILVTNQNQKRTVTIDQEALTFSASTAKNYPYKLPVIFHVFSSSSDQTPELTRARAAAIIAGCNNYYQNKLGSGSLDMKLTFELATTAAPGKVLTEPGIERITVTGDPTMDCNTFMSARTNVEYLWDPNEYINIMVYPFKKEANSDGVTLGVAHLPYVVSPAKLAGLEDWPQELKLENLGYPHCISINKDYIDEEESVEGRTYNGGDPIVTLSHELGHYLGLHHAFNEGDGDDIDLCKDTDYCDDTPAYNRSEYLDFVDAYTPVMGGSSLTFDDLPYLMIRKDCVTGEETTPNNVMDYDYSWQNRFTPEQEARVRYVLNYGTLVPGPKVGRSAKTRAVDGLVDLPMRMVR
jgi:zinc-dependent metalloproteinase lipoprotein